MAISYYVTQVGAGTGTGLSLGNAKSMSSYNAGFTTPTGGDTIFFSGTITSELTCQSSGTTGPTYLKYDFSGAVITTGTNRCIFPNGKNYIWLAGGGSFTAGTLPAASTFTPGAGTFASPTGGYISPMDGSMIYFNTLSNHDVKISGFCFNGAGTQDVLFTNAIRCSNLIVEQNYCDNAYYLVLGDKTECHDITVQDNYMGTPTTYYTGNQCDIVFLGDAYNITIQRNRFIQRTPGASSVGHNDCIQTFKGGGSNTAFPTNWVIRYNWIEVNVASGSGDTSWMILENFDGQNYIYGNVFVGRSGSVSNNGIAASLNESTATFYLYNNTFIAGAGAPGNTVRFLSPGTLYARNNIGYDATGGGGTYISWTMTEGGGATGFDYNFFLNWGTQTNAAGTHGSSTTNPIFTSTANDDYSLGGASTLRNAADNTIGATYNQGIAFAKTWPGVSLVNRTVTWDVGAMQFIASSGAPTLTSATINSAGTAITFVFNITVAFGAGGNSGWTASLSGGAATLTYSSGTGTTSLVYSISRGVSSGETGTVSYTQPGNGVESTADQTDLATLTNATVTNNSAQGAIINVTTLNVTTLTVG